LQSHITQQVSLQKDYENVAIEKHLQL